MARRPTSGDVIQLSAETGVVYVHYVGTHPRYGDGVYVSPTEHLKGTPVTAELFRRGYFTFFPVRAAVVKGLATVVGNLPSPGLPARMRSAGARSEDKVETWIITDGDTKVLKKELSESERQLPIAAIWNIEYLLQSVARGWRPDDE